MGKRKYLKEIEMKEIDLRNEKIKSKKYEIEIMQFKGREIQYKTNILAQELQREKDELKRLTDKIKKDFKITDNNFGYDPITGEVKNG